MLKLKWKQHSYIHEFAISDSFWKCGQSHFKLSQPFRKPTLYLINAVKDIHSMRWYGVSRKRKNYLVGFESSPPLRITVQKSKFSATNFFICSSACLQTTLDQLVTLADFWLSYLLLFFALSENLFLLLC